jgi:serine/threonine protein kinase
MNVRTIPELLRALSRADILDPEQQQELRTLSVRYQEPHALARALLERGWLTPFQVNQLLQGNAHDLRRGAYLLLERLGKGGMGQVYKARHRQLGRIVALKVIHKEQTANPLAIRRFCREIQAMGQLAHPNIVMAFDAGGEAGQHFVTMEYVTGVDLGQLVERRGPLPIWDACDTIRQAARGLQHAHEKGFIHRDIKPSNLLRAEPGGVVKLLDLGLARLSAEEREPVAPADATPRPLHTMLTQAGRIVGTPDFMAPEQARDSHQVDIRADLYSLGCTFYFLLTARMPFPGGTALEKLLRHNSETPRPVEQVRPQIPPAVAAVVRRLMAKQPAERYQTPAELVGVLDAILLGAAPVAQVVLPVATALPVLGDTAVDRSLPAVPNARANATAPRRAWRGRRGVIVAGVLAAVALLLILTLRLAHTPHHDDLSEARGEDNPPAPWTKRLSNSVGMQLVLIPAGRFTMGSPDS